MPGQLTEADRSFLARAIDISRHALENEGKTPFGALVVVGDNEVGRGTSSVVELRDPTAHAEVMALREAGKNLDRHLFPDGTMYASSEPCPMCLIACYWARIPRLVFAATSLDVATFGFEDLQFYRELTHTAEERALMQVDTPDDSLAGEARDVLRQWADGVPGGVVPKF